MSESHAEQLDPSVLGEEVGQQERAADADEYPPERPLGVDDPSIVAAGVIARDDVAQRQERMHADTDAAANGSETAARTPEANGLVDPGTDEQPGVDDDEQQLVADAVGTDTGPEAAAMRVSDDPAVDRIV